MSDKNLPLVSIVITNAFSADDLKECLNSLKDVTYSNFEIIVVDYGTPNIESIIIPKKHPTIKLIALDRDPGPSAMHNLGVQYSSPHSKYIIFLDSDTVVDPNFIEPLVRLTESDETIGAIQAKILLYFDPSKLNTIGDMANYLAVGWPDGYGEFNKRDEESREISFASAAGMLVRKDAFLRVGRFDEKYFIYADDLDFGLRLRVAGYRIISCPKSIVYHKYRFLRSKRNFYYLNRNRILTFLKLYAKKRTYLVLLPIWLVYELFVVGYGLMNGYYRELAKIYLDVLKFREYIKTSRYEISRYRKVKDREIIGSLGDEIRFSEISQYVPVKYFLNPLLKIYKKIALALVRW